MPRPHLDSTEHAREDVWLDAIEEGVATTAEIARSTGLTVRRVQQRLKAARQRLEAESCGGSDRGRDDLPWVELTSGPAEGLHYNLRDDGLSNLPSGPFRIGTARGGSQVAHAADDKSRTKPEQKKPPAKFKPKCRGKKNKPAARVAG